MKILIVDDSSTMLRIIKNTLNRLGYDDIVEAENGQDALDKFQKDEFGLILTDWNMPVMDGLTLVKSVRTINKEIPIMMITTEGEKTSILEALKAGVNNYIVKPFTPQTLKEKLEQVLGK